MVSSENLDFIALKQALRLFAQQRASLPAEQREQVSREMGELLVTLVSTADSLNVDLVRVAEEFVARRAANLPRLVHVRHPEDPPIS
jgi:hypothetical protein